MLKYLCAIFLILMTGCALIHNSHVVKDKFVEYVNDNKKGIRADYDTFSDKEFSLQIPDDLQSKDVSVGSYFLHGLNFNDNQKIVILYLPIKKNSIDEKSFGQSYRLLNINYSKFQIVCKDKDVLDYLHEIPMLRHRRFGINKLNVRGFYVFYLNIKRDKVNTFNYSINSIQL